MAVICIRQFLAQNFFEGSKYDLAQATNLDPGGGRHVVEAFRELIAIFRELEAEGFKIDRYLGSINVAAADRGGRAGSRLTPTLAAGYIRVRRMSAPAAHLGKPSRGDLHQTSSLIPFVGESRQWAPVIRIQKESVMRYIPTPDVVVERLKKQAKKLQRSGAGKHSDLLNRVAKQAGYDHWHHVVKCNENAKAVAQMRSIRDECEAVMAAERRGQAKAIVTKDGPACPPFVLFSTGIGDAWLLEPDEHLAMCLVWQGKRQPVALRDEPDRIEVEWDGDYELLGDFFSVHTGHPEIGERAIGGYPLDDIRQVLETAKSTLSKMTDVIGQWDVVDITDEVVARLVKKGWKEENVLELKAEGYRYSPNRDTLLGPVMNSDDLDDEQDDVEEPAL